MPDIAPEPAFDVCACYRLRKLSRQVTQLYDHSLEPAGLTVTQFSLLGRVSKRADLGVGELADLMMMDSTTLTRLLRPLEQRKLIALVESKEDRRRRVVTITDAGRLAWKKAVPQWRAAQAQLAKLLGERDFKDLQATVGRALTHFTTA